MRKHPQEGLNTPRETVADATRAWLFAKRRKRRFASAALLSDRQAMWAEVRSNFNDGTFGDKNDGKTIEAYWKQLEQLDYPNASGVRKSLSAKSDEK